MMNKIITKMIFVKDKIKRLKINVLLDILKLCFFGTISLIVMPFFSKKNIWLIEENPKEANDNGYVLLKYIRENRKDINIYYVIDKKSKNINKVRESSNIIFDKSAKHWIYYFNAKVIAVTQKYANPSPAIFYVLHNFRLIKGKRVFLQHGITKDNIKCYYNNVCKFDLFICGAQRECEYIRKNFGYLPQKVVYTGLARFDEYIKKVHRNEEKFILIAPTWRNWIINKNEDYEYFFKWNELINDEKFIDYLEEKNINVKFILHQEMNKFSDKIKSDSKKIQIYENNIIDYSQMLLSCEMLITDFSSLFFDVAYMKKPIIYFQFDRKEFRKKHLQEGYFSFENDGFGEIFEKKNDVIYKTAEYINNNFIMENRYSKRVDEFFTRRDGNNCKRIVDEIFKMMKGIEK